MKPRRRFTRAGRRNQSPSSQWHGPMVARIDGLGFRGACYADVALPDSEDLGQGRRYLGIEVRDPSG